MIGGRIGDDGLMVGNNMMLSIDVYEYDDDEEEEDDDDP